MAGVKKKAASPPARIKWGEEKVQSTKIKAQKFKGGTQPRARQTSVGLLERVGHPQISETPIMTRWAPRGTIKVAKEDPSGSSPFFQR